MRDFENSAQKRRSSPKKLIENKVQVKLAGYAALRKIEESKKVDRKT
jgi:hypothetical protein